MIETEEGRKTRIQYINTKSTEDVMEKYKEGKSRKDEQRNDGR